MQMLFCELAMAAAPLCRVIRKASASHYIVPDATTRHACKAAIDRSASSKPDEPMTMLTRCGRHVGLSRSVDIEANVESQVDDAASRWRPVALPGEPKWRALDGRIPLPCGTPRGVSGRSDRVWTRKIPLIVIVPQPRNGTLVRCCIKRSGPSDSLRTMYMKVESNERPPQ